MSICGYANSVWARTPMTSQETRRASSGSKPWRAMFDAADLDDGIANALLCRKALM